MGVPASAAEGRRGVRVRRVPDHSRIRSAHTGHVGKARSTGTCRVRYWCLIDLPDPRHAPLRKGRCRALHGKRDEVCCPGHEAGRRRTIGVVAALSINPRATTPMVRRWVAGTPMRPSGPEGRCQSNPVTVAVAAAVPGNPTKPDRPALSRIRPTDFNVSDGQAGSPPPQCPPSRFESLVAMIVGPASRRPIRALVDPRRAAHQSNAALVCNATWSRVFPSNTCVIGISPRSEPPKSSATSLTTRDHPIRTWPKSAENNEPPNHFTTRGKPRPIGVPGMALCQKDLTATRPAPHKVHAGLPRGAR